MNWIKNKKSNFLPTELVSEKRNIYYINLCARPYTPTEKEKELAKEENNILPDIEYIQIKHIGIPTTFDIKLHLLSLQQEYDKSDNVNEFTLNGNKGWLDKNSRIAIKNSIEIIKSLNKDAYTIWLGNKPYVMNISDIENMLIELEIYAMLCNDNTRKNIMEINNMYNREELLKYDITKGYPNKLNFNYKIVNN